MQSKTDQVKSALQAGDNRTALKIAAKFRMLQPTAKTTIQQAWSALNNPQFYRDIKKDPESMVDRGVKVLKELYSENQNG